MPARWHLLFASTEQFRGLLCRVRVVIHHRQAGELDGAELAGPTPKTACRRQRTPRTCPYPDVIPTKPSHRAELPSASDLGNAHHTHIGKVSQMVKLFTYMRCK